MGLITLFFRNCCNLIKSFESDICARAQISFVQLIVDFDESACLIKINIDRSQPLAKLSVRQVILLHVLQPLADVGNSPKFGESNTDDIVRFEGIYNKSLSCQ